MDNEGYRGAVTNPYDQGVGHGSIAGQRTMAVGHT